MSSRVLNVDPQTGIVTMFHYNESDDTFVIESRQPVEDIVEGTKANFNRFDERANWKGDLHRIASIPLSIFYELKRQGIIDPEGDPSGKKLAKWLNDSDNRVFRTRPGRV